MPTKESYHAILYGQDALTERAAAAAELRRHAEHYRKWKRPDIAEALDDAADVIGDGYHRHDGAGNNPGSLESSKSECPCDHGVTFVPSLAAGLSAMEIRKRWPRLDGKCPKGCGYEGIAYASQEHYHSGDW